jgi:AraC family transcriptional regulator
MFADQPLAVNPTDLESLSQLLPYKPTLSSLGSDNDGFLLLHYEQHRSHEIPEYVMSHHIVPIMGHGSQAKIEAKLDNQTYVGMLRSKGNELIPAGCPHRVVWDREITWTALFWNPVFIEQITSETVKGSQVELIPKHNTEDLILSQLGRLLKLELEAGYPSGRLYRESIAIAFATRLMSHHAACTLRVQSVDAGLSAAKLQIIISYIQEYLNQEIRLHNLAQLVDLSEYYLCRLFKQSMGLPLHQYVIQQRLERAKQLLKRKDLSIAYIAQECGFNSHSHLGQHFKRTFGVSPMIFRSQYFDN